MSDPPPPSQRMLIVSRSASAATAVACLLGFSPDQWRVVSTARAACCAYPGQAYLVADEFMEGPWDLEREQLLTELQLRGAKYVPYARGLS